MDSTQAAALLDLVTTVQDLVHLGVWSLSFLCGLFLFFIMQRTCGL